MQKKKIPINSTINLKKNSILSGFSKLSKTEKIDLLCRTYFTDHQAAKKKLTSFIHTDTKLQKQFDEFTENALTNFYMPLGVAPNFLINGDLLTMPMVIEESSVVAAAAKAAKFWAFRDGFKAHVLNKNKKGQVHFFYYGCHKTLVNLFGKYKNELLLATNPITKNMRRRGGGIKTLVLHNKTKLTDHYFQIDISFETVDAMGANFINSCLECIGKTFKDIVIQNSLGKTESKNIDILMCILSNYTPDCLVEVYTGCSVASLSNDNDMPAEVYAERYINATTVSQVDVNRAVTHNKGIMNGIDAVALATGNDFRAVEANVHAYASRLGTYRGLTKASLRGNEFKISLKIPLNLATVGGLTKLHPLVVWSLQLLGNPDANKLMMYAAAAGLAQNYAAINALITTGIQKGHMKMHLLNLLNQYGANTEQKKAALQHFKSHSINTASVQDFLAKSK